MRTTVDFDTRTADTGTHRITATPGDGVLTLTITYAFDPAAPGERRQLQNAMVWADGVLCSQAFYRPATISPDGRTVTWVLPVAAAALAPGPVGLVVTLWDNTGANITNLGLAGTAGVRPAPCLVPGTIVRSLFNLYPSYLADDPALAAAVRAAGVNTLMAAGFANPGDNPGNNTDTVEKWRALMDFAVKPQFDAAAALGGFKLLVTGDDLFRNAAEQDWVATCPFASQAVQEAVQRMVASGLVVGIEMMDEIGGDPTSNPIPLTVARTMRGVPGCPPMAWPNQNPVGWEQSDVADYASRFWTNVDWRAGRLDGSMTLPAMIQGIQRAAAGVYLGPFGIHPWLCQVSATADPTTGRGVTAADIVAQVWTALACGAAGFRVYAYDWVLWVRDRDQQGTRPGDPRWSGLAAAFTSVATREGELTTGHAFPPTPDQLWVRGRRGDLAWWVNTAESERPAPTAGTLLTPAGEAPIVTGAPVPSGGVVFEAK